MSLVPTESGEATPFDPFILAPIGGAIKGLSGIFSPVTRQVSSTVARQTGLTLPKSNILSNFFKSTKTKVGAGAAAGGATIANVIPKTSIAKATRDAVIAGSIPVSILGSTAFVNTPGGQEAIDKAKESVDKGLDIGKDLSEFIKANGQMLSIFLLIAGGALIIGAIKK